MGMYGCLGKIKMKVIIMVAAHSLMFSEGNYLSRHIVHFSASHGPLKRTTTIVSAGVRPPRVAASGYLPT